MDNETLGILAALGSAASWAVGSILFKRLGETLSPLAMTLFKGGISLLLLGAVLAATGGFDGGSPRALLILAASGLLGIAVGDALFFGALQRLGPHALAVIFTLGQVLTVILAVLLLGERPAPVAWAGIALILAGVSVVLHARIARDQAAQAPAGDSAPTPTSTGARRGIVLGLLSVIAMSLSILLAKEPLAEVSAMQATFVRMLAGTLGMFAFGLATRRLGRWTIPFRDPRLQLRFLAAVTVITFGGFWLSLVALKQLDVAVANTLISTEPLFVLPLAAVFLGEPVTVPALAGTLLAVGGMTLVFFA